MWPPGCDRWRCLVLIKQGRDSKSRIRLGRTEPQPFSWLPWRLGNVELFSVQFKSRSASSRIHIRCGNNCNEGEEKKWMESTSSYSSWVTPFLYIIYIVVVVWRSGAHSCKHLRLFFLVFLIFFTELQPWAQRGQQGVFSPLKIWFEAGSEGNKIKWSSWWEAELRTSRIRENNDPVFFFSSESVTFLKTAGFKQPINGAVVKTPW